MSAGPTRVLDALHQAGGEPCSGAALSQKFGVTRAQVWKDVETLRGRGYVIEASPGGGYALRAVPDRLFPEEIERKLDTRWLARRIEYLESTDSTNRVAFERAREGAPHGTAVIAEGQTAGRGRLGRSFFSPPGLNLYTSIVLRPQISTDKAPTWILASAVGVAEAVAAFLPNEGDLEIKWPNDLLLGGLKTCGILMELSAEATRVDFLVLGVGVNLNVARDAFPEEFRSLATSLRAHAGGPVDRVAFAARLYGEIERALDRCSESGFEALRPQFERRFRMAGRPVRVRDLDGSERQGIARAVDPDGALRLEGEDGVPFRVIAGDVTIVKEGT